jgi:hypothetical protein
MVRILHFACLVAVASAYSAPKPSVNNYKLPTVAPKFASTAAVVVMSLLFSMTDPAFASSKDAAQISLESLPPATISVQIGDLPIIGSLLSGTYTKVPDGTIGGKPSVVIKSPADKISAIKAFVGGGHLEFDVKGLINTHLDLDVGAVEPGVAKVRIASNLIPVLPFKNEATLSSKPSGKATPWAVVTNMGSGESYFYNEDTGVSQYERPEI